MLELKDIINHIRHRSYMSGIRRDALRVKQTGEVFTPTKCVQDCLDQIQDKTIFTDPTKTVIDNSAGDGQFLGEVLIRKVENGIPFQIALSTIFGVEKELDNVKLCQERLLCGQEDLRHIVEKNIVCHDALTYDYSFNGTDKTEAELRFNNLFEHEQ